VLARLEELDGIEHAETDFAGEFLRLVVTDASALTSATDLLVSLGYVAEPVTDSAVNTWYDAASVGQLSRLEAGIIADRVMRALRGSAAIDVDGAVRLRAALVDALHRCFVETTLTARPSARLRVSCVAAARAVAVPIVGATLADRVAALVDVDMGDDHTQRS
jgi:hypothetical protein